MRPVILALSDLGDAWRFVRSTPARRACLFAPVIINLVLWLILADGLVLLARRAVSLGSLLNIAVSLAVILAVLFLGVFFFAATSAILGAPFIGTLVRDAVRDAGGLVSDRPWLREIMEASAYTIGLLLLWLFGQLLLSILNVIPLLGNVLHLFAAFLLAVLFIGAEAFGEPFACAGLSYRDRLAFFRSTFLSTLAFSGVVFVLFLVPILNLFLPSIAAVAATRRFARHGLEHVS